jgi:hypothetical protein
MSTHAQDLPHREPLGADGTALEWREDDLRRWRDDSFRRSPQTAPGAAPSSRWVGLLRERGADRIDHCRGTFRDHLVGTWTILSAWRQPREVRAFGLFHSAYSTDAFETSLFGFDERRLLREQIGAESESLVFLFCTLDRTELALRLAAGMTIPPAGVEVRNWRTGERALLGPRTAGAIAVLEMANVAEQIAGAEGEPGHWVAFCSKLGALVHGVVERAPPVFGGCRFELGEEDEREARELYLASERDPAAADDLLDPCVRRNPWVGEPHLLRARQASQGGRPAEARRHAERGLELLCAWGTAWDKRRTFAEWILTAHRLTRPEG